jgi:hypothetical protein
MALGRFVDPLSVAQTHDAVNHPRFATVDSASSDAP